jgi:C4-dicarboxylate transporter DctM subunit
MGKGREMNEFIGPIFLGFLLLLMFSGVPVYAAMILAGALGYTYLVGFGAALFQMATISFDVVTNYDLLIIPFFVLMANILVASGLGKNLYEFAYAWFGPLPGGLCVATVVSCALFGAVCASETATTVTFGVIAISEMRKYGYDSGLACGSVSSADTLAVLIPPSSVLVIYGVLTGESIAELFIAGIIPGILLAIIMSFMVIIRCKINPSLGPAGPKTSFREKLKVSKRVSEVAILAALILTGIMRGWVTPIEAGAFGAMGAILLTILRKRINWQGFRDSIIDTIKISGMLYSIIVGAFIFVNFIVLSKTPLYLGEFIASLRLPHLLVMVLIFLLFIILGCFIEVVAMIVIIVPIFYPIIVQLGFSPIWFGIVIVVMAGIASITPPVGLSCYVIKGICPDVPLTTIFRGVFFFFLCFICFLVLLLFFPQIVTYLPSLMPK